MTYSNIKRKAYAYDETPFATHMYLWLMWNLGEL